MYNIKNISYAAFTAVAIIVIAFLDNLVKTGFVIERLTIPFILVIAKKRNNTMPMFWPWITAIIIIAPYKLHWSIFLISYIFVAYTIYYFKKNLVKLLIGVALSYFILHYGSWYIVSKYILDIDLLVALTGFSKNNFYLAVLVLLVEPFLWGYYYWVFYPIIEKRFSYD